MGSFFYNKNRMALADYMNSYFSHKSTDCTIYSDDGYEFPIHKVSFFNSSSDRVDLPMYISTYS